MVWIFFNMNTEGPKNQTARGYYVYYLFNCLFIGNQTNSLFIDMPINFCPDGDDKRRQFGENEFWKNGVFFNSYVVFLMTTPIFINFIYYI